MRHVSVAPLALSCEAYVSKSFGLWSYHLRHMSVAPLDLSCEAYVGNSFGRSCCLQLVLLGIFLVAPMTVAALKLPGWNIF